MPYFRLSERFQLYYRDHNPAAHDVVVLLHGLGASSASWDLQIPSLTQSGWRVIAPDLRGFGKSEYPGNFNLPDVAADIYALLQSTGIRQISLAGISLGGVIALQYALEYPTSISKLLLVNTFSRLHPKRLDVWLYFLARFILVHTLGIPVQARIVARRVFPNPNQEELRHAFMEQIKQANPSAYRAAARASFGFNVQHRLSSLHVPTLIISGQDDTTVPLPLQIGLAGSIPNSRHIIIPQAGHGVTVEYPREFNIAMLTFLAPRDNNDIQPGVV